MTTRIHHTLTAPDGTDLGLPIETVAEILRRFPDARVDGVFIVFDRALDDAELAVLNALVS